MWLLGNNDKWDGMETKCSQTFREGGATWLAQACSPPPVSRFSVALKNKSMLSTQAEGCDLLVLQRQMRSQVLFGEVHSLGAVWTIHNSPHPPPRDPSW